MIAGSRLGAAFIVLLVGGPFLLALYLSFTNAIAGSLEGDFIGFRNFVREWNNPVFRDALVNTFIFVFASQVIVLVGAKILANFLIRDFRGKWFLRFLIILPWAAPIALGVINLHGTVVPVLDLRRRFGLPPREYGVGAHVLVARTRRRRRPRHSRRPPSRARSPGRTTPPSGPTAHARSA